MKYIIAIAIATALACSPVQAQQPDARSAVEFKFSNGIRIIEYNVGNGVLCYNMTGSLAASFDNFSCVKL